MIILEGPDGGGKTTLAHKLLERMPSLVIAPRAVDSQGEKLLNIKDYIEYYLKEGGLQKRIFDRFSLISGPIYGSVNYMLGPNTIFTNRLWHFHMEALFLATRPVVIYCLPDLDIVRANVGKDPSSMTVVGNNLEAIYYQYQARAARDHAAGVGMVHDFSNPRDIDIVESRIRLKFAERGVAV